MSDGEQQAPLHGISQKLASHVNTAVPGAGSPSRAGYRQSTTSEPRELHVIDAEINALLKRIQTRRWRQRGYWRFKGDGTLFTLAVFVIMALVVLANLGVDLPYWIDAIWG